MDFKNTISFVSFLDQQNWKFIYVPSVVFLNTLDVVYYKYN